MPWLTPVHSLITSTAPDDWYSVAVSSEGSYGIEKDLMTSFPIRTAEGKWEIVQDLPLTDFSLGKIQATLNELKEEKALVAHLLG